jgi:hypothetical protein
LRWIGWLSLLLFALGWLAAELPLEKARPGETLSAWRRTVDGWERPRWLVPPEAADRPTLHPVIVGLLQVLLASAALIAFSPGEKAASDLTGGAPRVLDGPDQAPASPPLPETARPKSP